MYCMGLQDTLGQSQTVLQTVYPNPKCPSHANVLYGTSGHLGTIPDCPTDSIPQSQVSVPSQRTVWDFRTPWDNPRPNPKCLSHPNILYGTGLQDTLGQSRLSYRHNILYGTGLQDTLGQSRLSYRQYTLIPSVCPIRTYCPIPTYCMGLQDSQAVLLTVYPSPRSYFNVLYAWDFKILRQYILVPRVHLILIVFRTPLDCPTYRQCLYHPNSLYRTLG